jgi:nitrous-oxide reductase
MYNTEQAWDVLEIQASKNDKDFILAFNWKKAEQCFDQGKGKKFPGVHYRNYKPHAKLAVSEVRNEVLLMEPKDCPDMMYYLPTPKSPHGVDVDDTGEYIIGGGKLATVIPVHSFSKFIKAKDEPKNYITKIMEIPVLKYESTLHGEVEKPCLGPLHTEFDGKGRAYISCFVSSEVVQWDIKNLKVLAHLPAYYSIGHLSVVGGDTTKPYGKYLVALNKITKDRYLPTGMELVQSAQLYDISVDPPQLLLDFPTTGEPHYAQMIPASILLKNKIQQIIPLSENDHPYATKSEKDAKVVRNGREVHVYMTAIRSHFKPTKVEVKVGDKVYFHVTNLEQDFDIPHGFAIYGAQLPNILIMPGQTKTVVWEPKKPGVYPFYCTDFCSALHQEMQHYIRVSP